MRMGDSGGGPALVAVIAWLVSGGIAAATALDEGLSTPFIPGGGQTPVPALFDQTAPALAYDPQGARITLAAWIDSRSGGADIFAARFDSTGALLDPIGIPVAVGAAVETAPAVAFNGDHFLIVWAAHSAEAHYKILGARYDTDGTRVDVQPLQIAASIYELASPAVVWQGTEWLVVWTDGRSGRAEVYDARISAAGSVMTPNGGRLAGGRGDLCTPVVTLGSDGCLISWADEYLRISEADTTLTGDIGAVMADFSGAAVGEPFVVADTPSLELSPAAAFNGQEYLVVWNHRRDAGTQFVFGRRVTPVGEVQTDSVSIGRTIDGLERGFRESPRAVYDGQQFVVSWVGLTMEGVFGATVELQDTLEVVSDQYEFADARANAQSAVWNGSRHVFVYSHYTGVDRDVSVAFADGDENTLSGGGMISYGSPAQIATGLVFTGENYLAVWEEQCPGGWCARIARVSPAGEVLDPGGATLFAEPSEFRRYPTLAAATDSCLLVWTQEGVFGRDVMACLIDPSGARLSDDVLLSYFFGSYSQAAPACAWDGGRFLAAWRITGAVLGIRVGVQAGAPVLLDDYPLTFQEGNEYTDPGLAAFEGGFFGAWGEPDTLNGMQQDTIVTRSVLAKTVLPGAPALAAVGSTCQVVWTDGVGNVQAIRMLADGSPLEPGSYRLSSISSPRERPAVFCDGTTALAFWREDRAGEWVLVGARLGSTGSIQEPGVFTTADENPIQGWPLAAAGPAGSGCVMYSGLVLDDGLASLRVGGKLWNADPPEMALAVHQNPVLLSDIAIYAFPSEPLRPESVTMHANGAPLDVVPLDEESGVFRGVYEARATAAVNVIVEGLDLAGNLGRATRSFSVGLIAATSPFTLASPGGDIEMSVDAGGVTQPSVVLLSPDTEWTDSGDGAIRRFNITPLALSKPARLSIDLPQAIPLNANSQSCANERTFVLERDTPTGWVLVGASRDGKLTAIVDQLGGFRVRWTNGRTVSPSRLQLSQGPEPFRATLGIRYFLPAAGPVTLSMHDASGRRIRDLVSGPAVPGWHVAMWDGRDTDGHRAESGVYFTRLAFGADAIARRCVFMR